MKIPFFGKKKRPQNAEIIDIGMLKAIDERNKAVKAAPFQSTEAAPGPASDDFSFLGAMASAASGDSNPTTSEQSSSTAASTAPSGYSGYSNYSNSSASGIDPERFERLRRRIDNVIQRMELIERKIERIEHRVDLKY